MYFRQKGLSILGKMGYTKAINVWQLVSQTGQLDSAFHVGEKYERKI